ncbi:MAG: LysE family transporter [Caldilineaceae bacterium]|nr:LysE family transporter [Caldilineaceae bacterium]
MFSLLPTNLWLPLVQGFLLCASLIIAFGPQNLFLLQQGLHRRHLFLTALLCTLFDLLLIAVGVGGLGAALAADERWLSMTSWGGIIFLLGYGVRTLCMASRCQHISTTLTPAAKALSIKGTLFATISFSLLNPAAYVDTMLMIGVRSSHFAVADRLFFGVGAVTASALWFFSLIYGASRLAPLLRRPSAWRTIDLLSGSTMIATAAALVLPNIWLSIGLGGAAGITAGIAGFIVTATR